MTRIVECDELELAINNKVDWRLTRKRSTDFSRNDLDVQVVNAISGGGRKDLKAVESKRLTIRRYFTIFYENNTILYFKPFSEIVERSRRLNS